MVFFFAWRKCFIFNKESDYKNVMDIKKYVPLLLIAVLILCCKHKKLSLAENDSNIDVKDFVAFFPDAKLPYQLTDSVFDKEEPDSLLINYDLFNRFVPDSVLNRYFSKKDQPDIYPLGKIQQPKSETYLFIKVVTEEKEMALVFCMNKDNKFVAAKSLFAFTYDESVTNLATLDTKYTLTLLRQRKAPGADLLYKRDAYVLNNDAGKFMLILTESNETAKGPGVINPIDTVAKKRKFSGDYAQDKLNFIAVRDGRDASHILFFVHFEKDNGDCKGELKGEAKLISSTLARYKSNSDPCTVDFSFSPTSVSMKEIDGCGNHRDIKCFFEGTFAKQKPSKKKPAGKEHH
jgi:hypothetical protein